MNEFRKKSIGMVLGNGPSLKGFDFALLNSVDTLGMNAAYRFWDKINWYPNHYCCLDDQVIESHHNEIDRLYTDGHVRSLFVHSGFFAHHPERIGNPAFYSLDQVLPHWYNKRGKDMGFAPLFDHPAFRCSDTTKVTTGAFAVRFMAYMGYSTVGLMGIDLKYVEILPEARKTEGVGLLMEKTPDHNPNYFFDDYQKAGDRYNIPNPAQHQGNLHPQSFAIVAKDYAQNLPTCKIVNTNPKSALQEKGIFPLADLNELLGIPPLGSVLVPTNKREMNALLGNMHIWNQQEYTPFHTLPKTSKPRLVFAFNSGPEPADRSLIETVYKETAMNRYFSGLSFLDIALSGEGDVYQRDYTKPIGEEGYKAGPNNQFILAMKAARFYGHYTFQMETDCVPIRANWLGRLMDLVENSEDFWLMGSAYRGVDNLSPKFARHINGNAIYASGNPGFQEFLENFWEPRLRQAVKSQDRRLAYDCMLECIFSDLSDSSAWNTWQQVAHKMRFTNYIQNISAAKDLKLSGAEILKSVKNTAPDTFVIHSRPVQKFIQDNLKKDQVMISAPPQTSVKSTVKPYPKLLMIDSTPVGHGSATGQLKQTFLGDWPKDRFLQVWENKSSKTTLHSFQLGQTIADSRDKSYTLAQIVAQCTEFEPDAIYFRPIDSIGLFEVTKAVAAATKKPLILHVMDDWPERLRLQNPGLHKTLNGELQQLVDNSAVHLTICDAMSDAFVQRYGGTWHALANGVNPEEISPKDWAHRPPISKTAPFVIRYMGGLADDMNFQSVLEVAEAVAALQETHCVRLEIYTMEWYRKKAQEKMGSLPGVTVNALVADKDYKKMLTSSDALLIAYNFDPNSLAYIGLSLANKMPECLASGVPLLAYGPVKAATISYLENAGCAQVVNCRHKTQLRANIKRLVESRDLCQSLGTAGRKYVAENLKKSQVQKRFLHFIQQANQNNSTVPVSATKPVRKIAPIAQLGAFAPYISRTPKIDTNKQIKQGSGGLWHFLELQKALPRWIAAYKVSEPTQGRTFRTFVRLQANQKTKVSVSLARYDHSMPYAGTSKQVLLLPDVAQVIQVDATFNKNYDRLKLQVEIDDNFGGVQADIAIDVIHFIETSQSICTLIKPADINLKAANQRFRKGMYYQSLGIYMHLHQQSTLRMYADNALMAARRLGWESLKNIDDLEKIMGT